MDVWEGSPWSFDNKILILKKWSPNFHPTKDIIDKIPLWIRLPGLPIEYWDKEVTISITSEVGKVIRIDENCLLLERGLYARACV